jgi:hypothetical protein
MLVVVEPWVSVCLLRGHLMGALLRRQGHLQGTRNVESKLSGRSR